MSSGQAPQPGPGGFVTPSGGFVTPSAGGPPIDPALLPHDDKGSELKATVWVLTSIALFFLIMRIYCRILKNRRLLWEDWVLGLSFLCLLFNAIMVNVQTGLGYGKHFYDIPIENASTMALYGLVSITVIIMGQVWSKTSFAMTLLRISGPRTKIVVWFIIITINLFMSLGAIFFWVQCDPFSKAWTPLMVGGTCWDTKINISYGIFASVYSGLADLALAIVPWNIIMGLQLKTQERVGVALAMSLGAFAGVTAFVKASYLHTLQSPDFVYEGKDLVVWGAAETAVTIIASSIPVLRVLVRDIASKYGQGYVRSSENKSGGSRPGGGPRISTNKSQSSTMLGNHAYAKASPTSGTMTVDGTDYDFQPVLTPARTADPRRERDVEAEADSYEMTWQGGRDRKIYVQ